MIETNFSTPVLSSAEATEAVQRAIHQVDAVLMADGYTRDAHLALRDANAALQQAKARQLEADHAAAALVRDADREARALAEQQAQDAFADAVNTIRPVDGVTFAEPVLPPAVAAALAHVAAAEAALREAMKPMAAAGAARREVAARVETKVTQRAAIAARRGDGDECDGDAAEVSLLHQDLAALNEKLAPLNGASAAAAVIVVERRAAVDAANRALQTTQSRAELDAKVARVRAIKTHFTANVRTLRLAAEKLGLNNFGSTFQPSKALRDVANGLRV